MKDLIFQFILLTLACCHGFILDQIQKEVNRQICYDGLGCFSTEPPFRSVQRPIVLLPSSPETIRTAFELHTRSRPSTAEEQLLDYNNVNSVSSSSFDGSKKTKFLVHGYTHNGHRQWLQNMARALLKKEDMNVIIVDWGHGSVPPYTQAAANTRVVGAQIAKLITMTIQNNLTTIDKFHIIGHSLGAHIAGYAGERLDQLPRISALDPADPYFQDTDNKVRLDPSDAKFVDVIHTDSSTMLSLGMGAKQSMGHLDFFPNGGTDQPGCPAGLWSKVGSTLWNAVSKLDLLAGEGAVACSHERSYEYYTESILSACPFKAYPCTSAGEYAKGNCLQCGSGCASMGYYADQSTARGSMFLDTTDTAPYCAFHYQVTIAGNNSMDGKLTIVLQGTKGNTEPIALMTADEVHTQGHPFTKTFKSSKDIGTVTSVALRYDKIHNFILNLRYPDVWQTLAISLYEAETQKTSRFCATGKGITNQGVVAFGLEGTC